MAAPKKQKICTVCGEPFLPVNGRQKVCKECKQCKKPKPFTAAVKAADEINVSYGRYMAMSMEERNRAKEEKTMEEQKSREAVCAIKLQPVPQTAQITATNEQVPAVQQKDALRDYLDYLSSQEQEATARLEHICIAMSELKAYKAVQDSELGKCQG